MPRALAAHPTGRVDLAVLGLVGFVTSFGAHAVAVNLPSYAGQIGAGPLVIGILIAAYDLAEIAAKPIFGFLADRRGQVVTLWFGLVVFAAASLAYLVVDPRLLVAIRFLQGLGAAAFSVVSVALVAAYFPARRGSALGVYNALKGAGYIIAPVIGGLVVARTSFDGLFVATAGVGLVVLALTMLLREPDEPADLEDDDDDFSIASFLAPFRDRQLLPWFAIIVVNMFFVGVLFGFVPVLLKHLDYGVERRGWIVAAGSAAYVLVQPVAGWLADHVGAQRVIVVGLLASAVPLIVLPFVGEALLITLVVVSGLGIGIVWTNSDAVVSALADDGSLAASLGAAGSYKELGDMLGPLTVGAIAQIFGIATGFVACGVLGLIGATLIGRRRSEAPT